jgi:hypothetical protein
VTGATRTEVGVVELVDVDLEMLNVVAEAFVLDIVDVEIELVLLYDDGLIVTVYGCGGPGMVVVDITSVEIVW